MWGGEEGTSKAPGPGNPGSAGPGNLGVGCPAWLSPHVGRQDPGLLRRGRTPRKGLHSLRDHSPERREPRKVALNAAEPGIPSWRSGRHGMLGQESGLTCICKLYKETEFKNMHTAE